MDKKYILPMNWGYMLFFSLCFSLKKHPFSLMNKIPFSNVNTEYSQNIYTTSNIYKNMISVHKDSRTRWRMWARGRCCSTSVPPKDSTTTCRCCLTTSTCVPWRWWFTGAWLPYISHTSGTQPKSEKKPSI